MMRKIPTPEQLQADVDAFNARVAVGGAVLVKRDLVDELLATVTTSPAQVLSGHSAVVRVAGISGCYMLDRVTPAGPARRLICCCCGGVVRGRQFHNQDIGYGLGACCVERVGRNETAEWVESTYGKRGIHYDITEAV